MSVECVATVSTKFKRLFVRSLKWSAEDAGDSLWNVLKAAAVAKIESSTSGTVLLGTSSKGHSVTLSIPGSGRGYSPTEITEAIEEIIQSYEAAKAYLIAQGNPTPSDAQIHDEMLALMQPVTEVGSDYTELRTA